VAPGLDDDDLAFDELRRHRVTQHHQRERLRTGAIAGGSGQDNVYQFDGVNVTMPLFGTLSAEPAAHDVAQVTVVKGGARAIDFDRSGGFSIDSVSKSGSSRYTGMLSYQFQSDNMSAKLTATRP